MHLMRCLTWRTGVSWPSPRPTSNHQVVTEIHVSNLWLWSKTFKYIYLSLSNCRQPCRGDDFGGCKDYAVTIAKMMNTGHHVIVLTGVLLKIGTTCGCQLSRASNDLVVPGLCLGDRFFGAPTCMASCHSGWMSSKSDHSI